MTCIDTPISWLRLERFATSGADAQIAAHVAACPACAHCLDEIRTDVVALPPLAVPERRARPWWHFALPVFVLAAAALLFIVWPRDAMREDAVRVKGVGELILGIVRERDGVIRDDAMTFREGDRFKIVVTCPPAASAWIDLDVGGDHPLPATQIACGNRVVVPGAFHLTGRAPNRICVRVAADAAPAASAPRACVTVRPE
jgi:hypothetical protein